MSFIKNILLVDDDECSIFLTKRMISAAGFLVNFNEAKNGRQAIDFLGGNINHVEKLPDVIFLDLNMPIMNGWEFLEEYILIEPNIKKKIMLYIVSSSMSQYDTEKAKEFNVVTGFIIKPLLKDKVVPILENLTNNVFPMVQNRRTMHLVKPK